MTELYPISLRESLPTLPIPVGRDESDVLLALQPLIEMIYRRGRYNRTDYRKPCDPPLEPPDADWAHQLLKAAGRR
jgi:hypothetical protein